MNKIAIVTGVSRLKGIGKAICCQLAKQKVDIFFTYWKAYDEKMPWTTLPNEPELIQKEIQQLGVRCEKVELDLAKDYAFLELFDEVKLRMGMPSILINNATYSTSTDIDSITPEELDRHYAINLKATTLLTTTFIRQFDGEEGGRIINLISGEALSNMSNEIAYAITKGGVETLTRTLTQVAAQKGITINAVNPGLTDTGWLDEKAKAHWTKYFPMSRVGLPKDAANLVGFLTSEEGAWITGQIIHSEGGFARENYE